MRKIWFLLMFVMILSGCSTDESSTATKQQNDAQSKVKVAGDNATASGLAATSEKAYDLLGAAAAKNNEEGIVQMVRDGNVLNLPEGTKVLITDRGFATTQAKIIDGEYKGKEIWMPNELVK